METGLTVPGCKLLKAATDLLSVRKPLVTAKTSEANVLRLLSYIDSVEAAHLILAIRGRMSS